MLIGTLDLLFEDASTFFLLVPPLLVTMVLALLVAITVHEFGHALVAMRLGDATAQQRGRLSLNPLVHLDPAGTIMLLVAGFGWGKPVPVNTARLRNGRRDMALVALAGPLFNLLTASLFALPFQLGLMDLPSGWPTLADLDPSLWLARIALTVVVINVVLAVFNLLPLSPLDGSQMVLGMAPRRMLPAVMRLQLYGPVLLVGVIAIDLVLGHGFLFRALGPVINWITELLVE